LLRTDGATAAEHAQRSTHEEIEEQEHPRILEDAGRGANLGYSRPTRSRQQPARPGQERPVRDPVDRPLHLATEDHEVAKDRDPELRLSLRTLVGPREAKDAAQDEIEERPKHGAALSQTGSP